MIARLQDRVWAWLQYTLGQRANAPECRASQVLSEAAELAQAVGVGEHQALLIVQAVYRRAAGKPAQEIGGVATTLAAAAQSIGVDLDLQADTELTRMWTPIVIARVRHR